MTERGSAAPTQAPVSSIDGPTCPAATPFGVASSPFASRRIARAADLIALGETPADYNKHFVLTADIDLDPRQRLIARGIMAQSGGF